MQKVKRDFGTICSEEEERILSPLQGGRQRLLAPVTNVLIHFGITADMVSFASVGFACGFCLLAAHLFVAAFWLLVAAFICDGLDGVVARQTKTNTARGSFTDMFCDQSVVALSVAGLTWIGAIHPLFTGRPWAKGAWEGKREAEREPISWTDPMMWLKVLPPDEPSVLVCVRGVALACA